MSENPKTSNSSADACADHSLRSIRVSLRFLILSASVFLVLLSPAGCLRIPIPANGHSGSPVSTGTAALRSDLNDIERAIKSCRTDPGYPDDRFILVTVKEALAGARERNGGIGACLVNEATGEIVEVAHNRQYEPYFRSDLHAEMDLLTRYEERVRRTRSRNPRDPSFRNPRSMSGLALYTSLEPCPMCLTRIINSGLKKVYYAAPDPTGGMAQRFNDLPPFWKDMARGITLETARCSPELKDIAQRLFRPMFMHGRGIKE